jgi:hypothetical protein
MTQTILHIGFFWLLAVLAGFPLFVSMGLAAFAFVYMSGLTISIVPQKMRRR